MTTRPALLPLLALAGCTHAGAPSFDFFGAFFPAWMFCSLAGIAAAALVRIVLVSPPLLGTFAYPLPLCTAVGVIVALLTWLLFFR